MERDVEAYLDDSGYRTTRITPAALNLARDHGLLLLDLDATGTTGRITVADVRRAIAEQPKTMSKMRQVIARRLLEAKQTIPHFYVGLSVDMTDLGAYRKALKDAGYPLSVNDFVVKAVAEALREFPAVNSVVVNGTSVRWNSRISVGVAVSVDAGLVVPVLRDTDRMAMDELHEATAELVDKARSGKLAPEDMQGGTFTVSNMGMMGVEEFAAIINPGESAILAVASMMPAAVVNEAREIVVRDMMKITLSADHRVVDGAQGAAFVNAVKDRLEDVEFWRQEIGVSVG